LEKIVIDCASVFVSIPRDLAIDTQAEDSLAFIPVVRVSAAVLVASSCVSPAASFSQLKPFCATAAPAPAESTP
jgi:hypothetical protein